MDTHAIIAVRGGLATKSRCSTILNAAQREMLVLAMLEGVVSALRVARSVHTIHLTTPTTSIAELGSKMGIRTIVELPLVGLNAALEHASRLVARETPQARQILLPGDLPLITAAAIDRALDAHRNKAIGIIPSKDGGTSALILPPGLGIAPCFGKDSAAAHSRAAIGMGRVAQIIICQKFGFDVDEPADIETLRRLKPRGLDTALILENGQQN